MGNNVQRYRVVAPLILATVENRVHYVYAGGLVPLGATQEWIDRWLDTKLIEPVDQGPIAPPTADDVRAALAGLGLSLDDAAALLTGQTEAPADETGDGTGSPSGSNPLPDDAPRRAASRADWEAYAISRGLSGEAVKGASNKEALIETIAAQAV